MKPVIKFIIAVAVPLLVGAVSGYFTSTSVDGWFTTLNKPGFNPPGWLFAPVWTTLYILMGISFFLVWKSGSTEKVKAKAMRFYAIQLALNFAWSFIFFYLHQPGWAFLEILLLWFMILITIIWFGKISRLAAWLMIPYICWVSFASALNYAIWMLN